MELWSAFLMFSAPAASHHTWTHPIGIVLWHPQSPFQKAPNSRSKCLHHCCWWTHKGKTVCILKAKQVLITIELTVSCSKICRNKQIYNIYLQSNPVGRYISSCHCSRSYLVWTVVDCCWPSSTRTSFRYRRTTLSSLASGFHLASSSLLCR